MIKRFSPEAVAAITAGLAILVFALLLFGISGFKSLAVFLLFFVLPAYAIISRFDLDFGEKLFFALFVSLGVFPIAVWLLNKFLPSFRVSTVAALSLAVAFGFFLRFVWRKK